MDVPMDAPMSNSMEKIKEDMHTLITLAMEMEDDLRRENMYEEYEDLYKQTIPSVQKALKNRDTTKYPEMEEMLRKEVEEAEEALAEQQKYNEAEGLNPEGEYVGKGSRRGKGKRR